MQDFHNALFIFFLIRNNKLTVNLIQIFLHKSFIEDINFFRIDVYPAIFLLSSSWFLRVTKKSMFSSFVEGVRIAIFEFSVAKGSITWNGSKGSRPSEPEERASVINAAFQPFEIISLPFSGVK